MRAYRLVRKVSVALLVGVWALTQVPCWGQELTTGPTGEKIIVYPDGSARYFNDLTPVGTVGGGQQTAYPFLKADIEPLPGALSTTEDDLRRIAARRLHLAREALTLASTRASAATRNRADLETRLQQAQNNGQISLASEIRDRLTLARKLESSVLQTRNDAENAVTQAETALNDGTYVNAYNAERRRERAALAEVELPSRQDRTLSLLLPREPDFTGYGSATARAGLPEPPPCSDQSRPGVPSNGARALTPLLPLFSHTAPELRPFLHEQEYLTAAAFTSRDNSGQLYLHLNLTFTQASARGAYGTLPAGPSLSIHFLDGHILTLSGERDNVGILNHHRGGTLQYDVDYPLNRSATQALERKAVDFLRIYWSGGYEEYPVYHIDLLRRLVQCGAR